MIDAPSDDVWRVLADVERMPEWTASMTSARIVEGTATGAGVGLGLAVEIEQPRMPAMVWTVDELTPGRHFRWVATKSGVTTYGDHWVEPIDDGSRTAVRLGIRHTGPLASLVGALTLRRTARYVDLEAEGLKARCEAVAER
ncbi:SRPBCC family protein [Nocardioides sp. zg-1228]|uniref:SRPBCC family protein n=1 Tax=Nocardioides sp. zg-1228 TaxID=2763008 RepID=UPI001F120EAF